MRVLPNGAGSEVTFTLFQLPEMSDQTFSEDAGMVEPGETLLPDRPPSRRARAFGACP